MIRVYLASTNAALLAIHELVEFNNVDAFKMICAIETCCIIKSRPSFEPDLKIKIQSISLE